MPPKKRKLADGDTQDSDNLYEILQVIRSASHREVVQAYHRLALQVHPDRGGDASAFQKVAHAYEILADPAARDAYDRSLLERGGSDGLVHRIISNPTVCQPKVHVLADFPDDMAQVLLASPREAWRELLQGLRGEQLTALADCLSTLPANGLKNSRGKAQQINPLNVCKEDLTGTRYIHRNRLATYRAELNIQGLEFVTPATTLTPVLAFYHSAIVELRRCVLERLQARPGLPFETAVVESLVKLGSMGFHCPFTCRTRRNLDRKICFTPMVVDNLDIALQMRRELLEMPTVARLKQLKKKWDRMAQEAQSEVQARRHAKAQALTGYIFALQESPCDVMAVPLRRWSKQPRDVALKVPLLELQKLLKQPGGQETFLRLLTRDFPSLALPAPQPLGWENLPEAQRATVNAFMAIVDMPSFGTASKRCREETQRHMETRCGSEAVLTVDDFTTDPVWQLAQILSFLQEKYLKATSHIDLRRMPSAVMSNQLLWALLSTLPELKVVIIHQSHASCPPAGQARQFSIQVSL